jgi:hypothetical protein
VFKRILLWSGLFAAGVVVGFEIAWLAGFVMQRPASSLPLGAAAPRETVTITISATVDGSEHFIFTANDVRDEHGRWQPPKDVMFNEQLWTDLTQPPPGWTELAANLDLPRASIIGRTGRDVITLETTPEGFDVYFADTQMGAGKYTVTISIPRK